MSSRDAQVKRVGQDAPSWLTDLAKTEGDKSLAQVRTYRQVPRLKLIQGSARKVELKQRFGEGSAVIMPGEKLLARVDEPFLFVPLFMFTEFTKQADLDDSASAWIQERTFDEKSEVARFSRDANTRKQGYGNKDKDGNYQYKYTYVEHLVFAGVAYGEHELRGTTFALSFEKGEYFQGTNFCSAVLLRKVGGNSTPLWSQVWEFRSRLKNNKRGQQWYGYHFASPDEAFIREDEVDFMREQHEELQKQYKEKLIVVERDDADGGEVAPSENEM